MGDLVTMANSGAALETGLLTPALRQSLNVNEIDLTDEQFAIVAQFAASPPPPVIVPTPDEIEKLITTLAVVLKTPPHPVDHGKLKLAVYRRVLGRIPYAALQLAAHRAVETLDWMPTPAELLTLAKGHLGEAQRLHSKACIMRQHRTQRIHDERLRALKDKTLSHDDLQALPEFTARVADTQGLIVTMMDGTRLYRSKETIHAQMDERKRAMDAEDMNGSRAGETQTGGADNG